MNQRHKSKVRARLFLWQCGRCKYCSRPLRLNGLPGEPDAATIDHVIPKAAKPERPNHRRNLVLACEACNTRKGSRMLAVWEFKVEVRERA
jgi:5-methylcytosine-specific restriction endonuclease McrA